MRRSQQFGFLSLVGLFATLLVLSVADLMRLELLYIGSYLGMLAAADFTAPSVVRPRWRTRVRRVLVAGFLLACLAIGYRVALRLPTEAFQGL